MGRRFSWVSTVFHVKDRQQVLWWRSEPPLTLDKVSHSINIPNKTAHNLLVMLTVLYQWPYCKWAVTEDYWQLWSRGGNEEADPLVVLIEWLPAPNLLANQSANQLTFGKYLTPFSAGLSRCQGSDTAAKTLEVLNEIKQGLHHICIKEAVTAG